MTTTKAGSPWLAFEADGPIEAFLWLEWDLSRLVNLTGPMDCNGIHYSVKSMYGDCDHKKIKGLHHQPAARACTKGRGAGPAGLPHHERAIP